MFVAVLELLRESQVSLHERGVLFATLQWLHLAWGSLRDGADLKEAAVDFGDCDIASGLSASRH